MAEWLMCAKNKETGEEIQRDIWTFSIEDKKYVVDVIIADMNKNFPENEYWIEPYDWEKDA